MHIENGRLAAGGLPQHLGVQMLELPFSLFDGGLQMILFDGLTFEGFFNLDFRPFEVIHGTDRDPRRAGDALNDIVGV